MTGNYVLGLVGALITLAVLFELLRRRRLREKYALLWVVVAVLTLVIAVFPGTLTWVAQLVGVEVPANLLFFVASMLLMLVSIQHSQDLGKLDERTRSLAEEVALLRLELDQRDRPGRSGRPGHPGQRSSDEEPRG